MVAENGVQLGWEDGEQLSKRTFSSDMTASFMWGILQFYLVLYVLMRLKSTLLEKYLINIGRD